MNYKEKSFYIDIINRLLNEDVKGCNNSEHRRFKKYFQTDSINRLNRWMTLSKRLDKITNTKKTSYNYLRPVFAFFLIFSLILSAVFIFIHLDRQSIVIDGVKDKTQIFADGHNLRQISKIKFPVKIKTKQSFLLFSWGSAQVYLYPDSEIFIKDSNSAELENGKLAGQLFHNHPNSALSIIAEETKMKILGTKFFIENNNHCVIVAVEHGHVKVSNSKTNMNVTDNTVVSIKGNLSVTKKMIQEKMDFYSLKFRNPFQNHHEKLVSNIVKQTNSQIKIFDRWKFFLTFPLQQQISENNKWYFGAVIKLKLLEQQKLLSMRYIITNRYGEIGFWIYESGLIEKMKKYNLNAKDQIVVTIRGDIDYTHKYFLYIKDTDGETWDNIQPKIKNWKNNWKTLIFSCSRKEWNLVTDMSEAKASWESFRNIKEMVFGVLGNEMIKTNTIYLKDIQIYKHSGKDN